MKRIAHLGSWLSCLPLAFAPLAFQARGGTQNGNLKRVDPQADGPRAGDESRDLARALTHDFERDEWRQRLTQPDLERRERSFDLLLKRARFDAVARAFLEELAHDPQGGELTWTARLALKQLGRASMPLNLMLPGSDPLGPAARMQQMMDEMLAQSANGFLFAPQGAAAGGQRTRSVHIEQDGDGAHLRISEGAAGQERVRNYDGESLEEILQQNPELRAELDGLEIAVQPGSGLDLRLDLGRGGLDPLARHGRASDQPPPTPQGKTRPINSDRLGVMVQPLDAARAKERGLESQGLLVERTYPETYAQLLGVGVGSVLLELNGQPLRTSDDIERAMRARGRDDALTLVWLDELGQRQEKTWGAAGDKR